MEKHEKKWKMKFIKIWHYNEELEKKLDKEVNYHIS